MNKPTHIEVPREFLERIVEIAKQANESLVRDYATYNQFEHQDFPLLLGIIDGIKYLLK